MKLITLNNARDYILEKFDQADILAYFLNIQKTDINYCLKNYNNRISNPLRLDRNPSMGFRYYDSKYGIKLITKDFANSYYSGDIFDIVGIVEGKNPYNPKEFIHILYAILKYSDDKSSYSITVNKQIESIKSNKLDIIEIQERTFDVSDYIYWIKHGIIPEYIKEFNIIPIEQYWKNGYIAKYNHNENDPCYCYYLGKKGEIDITKLYFPKRSKGAKRFDTNCNSYIEAPHELINKTNLIITKSRKDKILMTRIVRELKLDVCITNSSSEWIIPKKDIEILRKIYKNIYSIFDPDEAGITSMKEMYKTYKIIHPFFSSVITEKLKDNKDLSGYCYNNDYNKTKELFYYIYSELTHLT